jgi:hypothetical protein
MLVDGEFHRISKPGLVNLLSGALVVTTACGNEPMYDSSTTLVTLTSIGDDDGDTARPTAPATAMVMVTASPGTASPGTATVTATRATATATATAMAPATATARPGTATATATATRFPSPRPARSSASKAANWVIVGGPTAVQGQQGAYVTIVAAHDDTVVQVTPSVATLAGPGVPAGQPNVPFQIVLDEGDTAEVMTKTQGVGLTGTRVNSDEAHPIGVFSGQECAFIPANVYACDHLEDQLSGLRLWGTHFIASRMPPRVANPPETTLWQIYASEDDTTVDLNASMQVTGLPNNPFQMNAGQLVQFYASGTQQVPGDFEVIADKPIAVVNYMTGAQNIGGNFDQGDPAMVQLSPVEQYLPRYVVLVPGTWINDFAVITRPAGASILIDNVEVPDASFVPVANSGFEVARVQVGDGVHLLDGGFEKFSVVIVGYDQYDSYAYLGGTGTGVINPNPQ